MNPRIIKSMLLMHPIGLLAQGLRRLSALAHIPSVFTYNKRLPLFQRGDTIMAIFLRKTVTTLLVIGTAALLTIGIGHRVQAQMAPAAWIWGGHLWNYSTFKLDNSTARSMTEYMIWAGNDYSSNTDLNIRNPSYSHLYANLWRGDEGRARTVSIVNGAIQWNSAPAWSNPIGINTLPGSGSIQTQVNYRLGNDLYQSIWQSNYGYFRTVPIVNNVVQWNSASAWSNPIAISGMPGSGNMQAHGDYAVGNTLMQAIWRGNQGWSRSVPIVNGVVQWNQAGAWSGPININTLPGGGDIQATDNYVVGNTYWQSLWRSNVQWTRYAPIINGSVEFGQASDWWITTSQENLPGSGSVQAQGHYVLVPGTVAGTLPPEAIRAEERNLGATGYHGLAMPMDAEGWLCYIVTFPTGFCNMTNDRATSARILFSTYYGYPNQHYLARHEMGHVFGLYHPSEIDCPLPLTVMYVPSCPQLPTLQQDEINWINWTY